MGCIESKDLIESNEGAQRASSQVINPMARSESTMNLFPTGRDVSRLIVSESIPTPCKVLLGPPFSNFSIFSVEMQPKLYLTGLSGITREHLKRYPVKGLINVAEEIPDLELTKRHLIYHKYSIAESYTFQIYDFLDKVTKEINNVMQQNDGLPVVFCVSGMSRSATVVLAYAVKYLRLTIKEAFRHLQECRPYARPNLSFFQQLIRYERECFGSNSISLVKESLDETSESKTKKSKNKSNYIRVPDFYRNEYPHLLKLEIDEANQNTLFKQRFQASPQASRISLQSSKKSSAKIESPSTSKVEIGTNELRPFMVERISYKKFVNEYQKAVKQQNMAKTSPRSSTTSRINQ